MAFIAAILFIHDHLSLRFVSMVMNMVFFTGVRELAKRLDEKRAELSKFFFENEAKKCVHLRRRETFDD